MTAQVLVVDDEESVRTTEAEILRRAGYEVVEASDGLEALQLLQAQPVGVVVLDIRMPGADGFDVLARLEHPPPVVLVSAHTLEDGDLDEVAEKGAVFLAKPVPPGRLLEQVRQALQRETSP